MVSRQIIILVAESGKSSITEGKRSFQKKAVPTGDISDGKVVAAMVAVMMVMILMVVMLMILMAVVFMVLMVMSAW